VSEATRYSFVLGTGRCGSTLVQEIVSRHPAVGFVSNFDDRFGLPAGMGRWNNTLYRRVPSALTRKGRLRFAPSEAYRILDRDVSPLVTMPMHDLTAADASPWLRDRLRTFFDTRADAQAHAAFVHKFTGWPRVGFLESVFPDSRYVHIVRDGRAVASSWLQMPWWLGHKGPEQWHFGPLPDAYAKEWEAADRSFVLLAGLAWKLLLDAFAEARTTVAPGQWLELRYEDVAAAPEASMAKILEFLELEPDRRFDEALRRIPISTGRTDAFRRDLPEAAVELLTASLAEPLAAHGYEV
jgi:hypothetical protein